MVLSTSINIHPWPDTSSLTFISLIHFSSIHRGPKSNLFSFLRLFVLPSKSWVSYAKRKKKWVVNFHNLLLFSVTWLWQVMYGSWAEWQGGNTVRKEGLHGSKASHQLPLCNQERTSGSECPRKIWGMRESRWESIKWCAFVNSFKLKNYWSLLPGQVGK